MKHGMIDKQSLAMAEAILEMIDHDPERRGLARARVACERWLREFGPDPNVEEWCQILTRPWNEIRRILLNPSEEGKRLRQNSPFAGVLLPPRQRWDIYRKFRNESSTASLVPIKLKRLLPVCRQISAQ